MAAAAASICSWIDSLASDATGTAANTSRGGPPAASDAPASAPAGTIGGSSALPFAALLFYFLLFFLRAPRLLTERLFGLRRPLVPGGEPGASTADDPAGLERGLDPPLLRPRLPIRLLPWLPGRALPEVPGLEGLARPRASSSDSVRRAAREGSSRESAAWATRWGVSPCMAKGSKGGSSPRPMDRSRRASQSACRTAVAYETRFCSRTVMTLLLPSAVNTAAF